MIPVLYKFTLETLLGKVVFGLIAVGLVVYAFRSGWKGAHGPANPKTGEFEPAPREEKIRRAVVFALIGVGLVGFGLYYALPWVPFIGKGRGEGIPIHTYGVLVGTGFIAAITVSGWLALREWPGEEGPRKRDQVLDLAFWVFVGAFVGSRVLFIIVNWQSEYAHAPLSKMFSLEGGLVFQGGLIGAAAVAFFYARKHDIDFLRLADIALPTVSLGAAFGRLGCFSAGCCWGRVTHESNALGVHFPGTNVTNIFGGPGPTPSLAFQSMASGDQSHKYVLESTGEVFSNFVPGATKVAEWVAQHGHTLKVWPTQLFDSFGNLLLFLGLITLRRYRRFHGQITGIWLMLYAVVRTSVELFRGDTERGTLKGYLAKNFSALAQAMPDDAWYNLSTGMFISLAMFTLGAVLLVRNFRAWQSSRVDLSALAAT